MTHVWESRGVVSEFSGKNKTWKGSYVFLLRIPSIKRFLGFKMNFPSYIGLLSEHTNC